MTSKTTTADKCIVTPRNRLLTPRQYLALVRMTQGRGNASPCVHGHFDCAAWNKGPCENELAAAEGMEGDVS